MARGANEQDVAVAVDSMNNYKIYYLKSKDSDELKPYTLDETNNNFIKLLYRPGHYDILY
jgi:hypothetical protein